VAEERVQRRLAAILAADVVGYSRLMGEDEIGTRRRFKDQLDNVITPAIDQHSGRLVKTMGDGLLVEFRSVVDAVQCAAKIQENLASVPNDIPQDNKLFLRIGVHLGDVIVEDDDIHGDGVNIAARLEGIASPGGIYISEDAYRQVRGKVAYSFDDLGKKEVKNIADLIHVYSVCLEPDFEPSALMKVAGQKSTIAVLPFDNLSGDREQDFIGEGLTEDIITALSRIRSFFVIARNSTFQYKGKSPDIRAVSRVLGAQYIVEGSSRRSRDRIRISVQLIDGHSGNHIWAERYDREFEDLFQIQDDITKTVVAQLEPELAQAEYDRVKSQSPDSLQSWELFHRGMIHQQRITKDEILEARRLFQKAVERDPNMACAYAGISWTYSQAHLLFGDRDTEQALQAARRAIELDDRDSFAHLAMGRAFYMDRRMDAANHEFEEAIRINPSNAYAHIFLGGSLVHLGMAEEALPHLETGMLLSPADPNIGPFRARMANACLNLKRYEDAVTWGQKAIQGGGGWPSRVHLISALGHLGRKEEAHRAREELEAVQAGVSVDFVRENLPTIDPGYLEHYLDGLRKAGLPEKAREQDKPLPLPDKPSIAVLPFENMSGDPEQEYFSDGICEDIITALSRLKWLFVTARNSSFSYKGRTVDVRQVAEELGVRYVLEGSVRKSANRVRITAQLIDGQTGNHIWAERYDRELEDIFAVQDEITQVLVGTIEPELGRAEQTRAGAKAPENMDAWEAYQRGMWHAQLHKVEELPEAERLLRRAIELDPKLDSAFAALSELLGRQAFSIAESPDVVMSEALRLGQEAVRLDSMNASARCALGRAYLHSRKLENAVTELRKSIDLNPSYAHAHFSLGTSLICSGQAASAIAPLDMAMRLSPRDYLLGAMMARKSEAYVLMKDYDRAIEWGRKAINEDGSWHYNHFGYVSALGHVGRPDEARDACSALLTVKSDVSIDFFRNRTPMIHQPDLDHLLAGLRKAGLQEK
jgi:TolB-like protein/Tfp pilus assembly protein PilF